jgi:replicative DNA helicase
MIVVAARPAMGKSTLGLDIARSAAIKHRMASVVFSLEMSKTEITMRLLSAEAQIQLQHMRKGTMRDDDWNNGWPRRWAGVRRAAVHRRLAQHVAHGDPGQVPAAQAAHNLKLVVIDYLQLMSSGKRVESRQQEVSEFSRALKLLAKELEVPVIAISQLNRGPSSAPTSARRCPTCGNRAA